MKELNHCPSTLADGFSIYSPTACKKLFDGQKVSHLLNFEIDEISKTSETMIAMRRISVSGAQEKFPAVIENGIIRISQTDERSRYILKPAPWDNTLYTRKQIPANEHLTMQITSQVYGIITAENGLCFTLMEIWYIYHQLLPSFFFLGLKGEVCQCRRGAWGIWKFRKVNWPSSAPDNKKGWQGV